MSIVNVWVVMVLDNNFIVFGFFDMMFSDFGVMVGVFSSYINIISMVVVFVVFLMDVLMGVVLFILNNGVIL